MIICVLNKADAEKFTSVYSGSTDRFDDPDVISLGIVDDEVRPPVPCGMLVASVLERSLNLEWLYVLPEYRRKKAATYLLDELMTAADRCEADEVFCTFSERNEGMGEFMSDFGFAILNTPGYYDYVMRLKDFKDLPAESAGDYDLDSFFSATSGELEALNASLEATDVTVGVPLPVYPWEYSPLSVCVRKNGEITGLLLIKTTRRENSAVIDIPWVYMKKECIKAMPAVYGLAMEALRSLYPEDTEVRFETLSPEMDSIIEKIAPDADFAELYSAHWLMG